MSYEGYVHLGYKPKNDLVCTFRIEPSTDQAREAVAAESSIGTWKEVATMTPRIKKMGAKVFWVKGNNFKIAYPSELFEPGNMPQIFSSVAGNIFNMKEVKNLRLEDIEFPIGIEKSFPGPKHGIAGVRKILHVPKRPLCGTIIKPKLGLDSANHARVAYEAWAGGLDIVKDDENLSSQKFNPFARRLDLTFKSLRKAEKETGEKKAYMPNVTAETKEMLKRAKMVKEHGGTHVMVDVVTCGFSAVQTLREETNLIIHGHRAMHGAFTRNPKHGISMLPYGKALKLVGVDQLHVGTAVGKMEETKEQVVAVARAIRPVFPVCSGGLEARHVMPLVKMLGRDIIIQAGGGIHGYPGGTRAGAAAMRKAVENV